MNTNNMKNRERLASGHRTCPGCAIPIIVRTVLSAINEDVVVVGATGCMEVTTTIYPYTSWNVPFMHNAFENAAATISGIESAYKALKAKGNIKNNIKFVVFGGDGGTYDIGLQSLSGAIERGHDFLYVCYDNEAYQNTGNQRSSASPKGSKTSTTPIGKYFGKYEYRKDLTKVIAGHNIAYCAQASIAFMDDLINKVKKAMTIKGPKFINVLSPCTRYWGIDQSQTVDIAKLAVETNFWPIYEIENGKKYTINLKNHKTLPITEYLKTQARFKHLLNPVNKKIVDDIQNHIDEEYKYLLKLEQISN